MFKNDLKIGVVCFEGDVDPWSLDVLCCELRREMHSESDATLLFIRSPGGYCFKVPETARLIEKFEKPIVAYTDLVLASAAYWLAASCDAIYAAPSAMVGSVGAYIEIHDLQKYYERLGIEHKVLRGGDRKARQLDGQLDEREMQEMQAAVDASHAEFIRHVLRHRSIDREYMQGQVFGGADALAINMIDGLADSAEDLIVSFNQGG